MEERAERLALYIIENQTTVRAAAQKFGISKSTVHTDATKWNGPSRLGPFFPVRRMERQGSPRPLQAVITMAKAVYRPKGERIAVQASFSLCTMDFLEKQC